MAAILLSSSRSGRGRPAGRCSGLPGHCPRRDGRRRSPPVRRRATRGPRPQRLNPSVNEAGIRGRSSPPHTLGSADSKPWQQQRRPTASHGDRAIGASHDSWQLGICPASKADDRGSRRDAVTLATGTHLAQISHTTTKTRISATHLLRARLRVRRVRRGQFRRWLRRSGSVADLHGQGEGDDEVDQRKGDRGTEVDRIAVQLGRR